MQHRMGNGDLLDGQGRLIERGWASGEVRRYDRKAIRASGWRIKEWDYYCVATDSHALALTVADNGYLGFLGLSWMDLVAGTATNHGTVIPFPFGRMNLPSSADAGDIRQCHGGVELEFRLEQGARQLTFAAPGFDQGKGLSGQLRLQQPADDRMAIATPFADAPRAFYYNQKINCMPASGEVLLAGKPIRFEPESAFAVLDWGRGVWTYDNTWYWASASGFIDGEAFGFNFGYGFSDRSPASENLLLYRGRAHKLDQIIFHFDRRNWLKPWRISSNDGRVELEFIPRVDRNSHFNALLIASEQHQVFGHYRGHVTLDNGQVLQLGHLPGFAEEVRNRW